jgi:hypothetical protein
MHIITTKTISVKIRAKDDLVLVRTGDFANEPQQIIPSIMLVARSPRLKSSKICLKRGRDIATSPLFGREECLKISGTIRKRKEGRIPATSKTAGGTPHGLVQSVPNIADDMIGMYPQPSRGTIENELVDLLSRATVYLTDESAGLRLNEATNLSLKCLHCFPCILK